MPSNFPWSQMDLTNSPQARIAFRAMLENGNEYHNWDHIVEIYTWLFINKIPYNTNLDWAVLYHDVVYDGKGSHESRSMIKFQKVCKDYGTPDGVDKATVTRLIQCTTNHIPRSPLESVMVRADLHALTDPIATYQNFGKLVEEGKRLYKIDERMVMLSMQRFLNDLYNRVAHNQVIGDTDHAQFYADVNQGIGQSMSMCRALTDRYRIKAIA